MFVINKARKWFPSRKRESEKKMKTHLVNKITGLYFNGANFSGTRSEAVLVEWSAHTVPAWRYTWGNNVVSDELYLRMKKNNG